MSIKYSYLNSAPSSLRIHSRLEQTLTVIYLILFNVRTNLNELLVGLDGFGEGRHVVVAVTKEGEGGAGTGEVLEFELRGGGGLGLFFWGGESLPLEFFIMQARRSLPLG